MTNKPDLLCVAAKLPPFLMEPLRNAFTVHMQTEGAPLDRIRAGNTQRNLAGVPDSGEFCSHGAYEGAHRERQIEIA